MSTTQDINGTLTAGNTKIIYLASLTLWINKTLLILNAIDFVKTGDIILFVSNNSNEDINNDSFSKIYIMYLLYWYIYRYIEPLFLSSSEDLF